MLLPRAENADHRGTLGDEVYRKILSRILDGSYPLRGRLPTENELSSQCGASRPVVRQALMRLREDGVIETRQGSGSLVVRRPDAGFEQMAPLASIADIQRSYEFRIALEGEIAGLAAQRRSAADLANMRRALKAFDEARDRGGDTIEPDLEFHLTIARSIGNPLFERAIESLRKPIVFAMTLTRQLVLPRRKSHLDHLQAEHRRIVDAIARGDAAAARRAARRHIQRARRSVFEGR